MPYALYPIPCDIMMAKQSEQTCMYLCTAEQTCAYLCRYPKRGKALGQRRMAAAAAVRPLSAIGIRAWCGGSGSALRAARPALSWELMLAVQALNTVAACARKGRRGRVQRTSHRCPSAGRQAQRPTRTHSHTVPDLVAHDLASTAQHKHCVCVSHAAVHRSLPAQMLRLS
jgi:hypothetical protein